MHSIQERANVVAYIRDLEQLVGRSSSLSTPLYRQALKDFNQQLEDKQALYDKVKVDYERNKKLFEARVIASSEFEGYQFEYTKSVNELEHLHQINPTIQRLNTSMENG